MKAKILIICLIFFTGNGLHSQNITNTFGTSGIFSIKDNSVTYFRVNQSNGTIQLAANSGGNQRGFLFIGSDRYLHTFYRSGTDGFNTFLGINSGNFNLTGSSLSFQGSYNTAAGYMSLNSLTNGYFNSAFGINSLALNTSGNDNASFGSNSLYSTTSGSYNSAFGSSSLNSNTFGSNNSAFGYLSLYRNTTGIGNSAFGYQSMRNNILGSGNTAIGNYALFNSTGSFNTSIGDSSGLSITSGSNNIAIGYFAQVPTGTASNQIRLGNTAITFAGIQVAWTVTSDRNLKINILNSDLGLGFITKLRPVSYTRRNDESAKTEYGLIAQEVEEVLLDEGIKNNGMLTKTDEGEYQLRYNDLLAPMIKAIQELKYENDKLKSQNEMLEARLADIEEIQKKLVNKMELEESKQNEIIEVNLGEIK